MVWSMAACAVVRDSVESIVQWVGELDGKAGALGVCGRDGRDMVDRPKLGDDGPQLADVENVGTHVLEAPGELRRQHFVGGFCGRPR